MLSNIPNSISCRELIDTLWNVNFLYIKWKVYATCELIDTLWNVNYLKPAAANYAKEELIDTLWNVNKIDLYCLVRLRLTN